MAHNSVYPKHSVKEKRDSLTQPWLVLWSCEQRAKRERSLSWGHLLRDSRWDGIFWEKPPDLLGSRFLICKNEKARLIYPYGLKLVCVCGLSLAPIRITLGPSDNQKQILHLFLFQSLYYVSKFQLPIWGVPLVLSLVATERQQNSMMNQILPMLLLLFC